MPNACQDWARIFHVLGVSRLNIVRKRVSGDTGKTHIRETVRRVFCETGPEFLPLPEQGLCVIACF
jgi:hypothetical protein